MAEQKVDLKDLKILSMLDKNARLPYAQIGRALDLSETVVKYRIEKMQKLGVLKGFLAFIDTRKIGYRFHNIYIKLKVMSEEKENELIQKIKKMSSVCWLVTTAGHYNLIVSILAKDTHHVEKIHNELMQILEHNIVDDSVFMTTDAFQLPYPLLEENSIIEHSVSIGRDKGNFTPDKLDLKILYELSLNCRITNLELSRKLNVGIDKVTEHVDRLLESDLVKGFKPLINMNKLGKHWYILMFKLKYIDEETKRKFVQSLKMMRETFFIVGGVGNFGMQVEFFVDNYANFREVLNKIFPTENSEVVKEYTELKVIKEHKCFFFPVEINEEQAELDVSNKKKKIERNVELERFV